MQKHILGLTTSAFILACGAIPATAQQEPLIQLQPQILQQQQELQRQLQGVQSTRPRGAEDDSDQDDNGHGGGGRMIGSWHHRDWGRGAMGPGMMGRGGTTGPGGVCSGIGGGHTIYIGGIVLRGPMLSRNGTNEHHAPSPTLHVVIPRTWSYAGEK